MATNKKDAPAVEEQEETMAEETTQVGTDDRVEIHIHRAAANEDPNLFVSINGKAYILPKGKTSKVPKEVAAEIKRAEKAQQAWDEKSAALAKEGDR